MFRLWRRYRYWRMNRKLRKTMWKLETSLHRLGLAMDEYTKRLIEITPYLENSSD